MARGGARWPEFPNKGKWHFKRYGCGGSASKRGCSGFTRRVRKGLRTGIPRRRRVVSSGWGYHFVSADSVQHRPGPFDGSGASSRGTRGVVSEVDGDG